MSILLALILAVAFSGNAMANPACAVCTIAVGASLEIARKLGVDDSVVGVWAGALLVMIGFSEEVVLSATTNKIIRLGLL